jgi:hypothetical protein
VAKKEHFPRFYSNVPDPVSDVVADLKTKALDHGATLEAIQLLCEVIPLTQKEQTTMANPKAAAAATKLATKKTPDKAPPKGEAVPKVPRNFDYKIVKGTKNETRAGTWTNFMVETILEHTNSDAARAAAAKSKEFGDKKLDFAWAKAKNFITY